MDFRRLIIKLISTFFYIGYFPFIPGTFASLVGILIFYFFKDKDAFYLLFTLGLVFLGYLVTAEAEKNFQKKDPKCVVIDEISGMLVSLLSLPFYNSLVVIIAFVLFRILDTLKPFPAGRLQDMSASIGIMSDDLVAGFYTNIILQVVLRLLP